MGQGTHQESIKSVWRVCYVLAIVTGIEIAAALSYYYFWDDLPRIFLNLFFIIMSAVKVYYIMGEFMHLRYELKPMTISIMAPFSFLIWGIIAFLWEGSYYLSVKEFWNYL
jgi:cytochrome c oxidase subunit IV